MTDILIRLLPYAMGIAAIAGGYLYAYTQGKESCQQDVAEQTIEKIQASRNTERQLQSAVSDIDSRQLKIQELEHEISTLRRAVDSGNKRLYVAAKRPDGMPSTTDGSGLGDVQSTELDPKARQDYYDLRSGIQSQREQLIACQQILIAEREIFNNGGAVR